MQRITGSLPELLRIQLLSSCCPALSESERISRVVLDYASRIGAEQDSDHLLQLDADLARDLTGADRCSIWLADRRRNELWTKVAHGTEELRIPLGQGLVGSSVETNEAILINDAASDPRFHDQVDRSSGYVTRSSSPSRSAPRAAK